MDSQVSIEIDRPIEQVFNAANECITEWSVTCVSDEIIEDKGGVGTTFRMVTQERGKEMEFTGEVTRWDPPSIRRSTWWVRTSTLTLSSASRTWVEGLVSLSVQLCTAVASPR